MAFASPAVRATARRLALDAVLALGAALCASGALAQAPDAAPFDALLRTHVKQGQVSYAGFQDSAAFRTYVADLGRPARLDGRDASLAYHLNAYNAFAIQAILDGLSPTTMVGRLRYFRLQAWPLDGRRISLHDLEHEVLRPLREPRVHFAIVCASRSCPPLRPEAYTAAKLDAQLDDQARAFVNDRFRNRFDKATRTAHLSEIFKWFDEDFRAAGSVQRYVARYVDDPEVARELAQDAWQVAWIDYDWTLNGTPPRP